MKLLTNFLLILLFTPIVTAEPEIIHFPSSDDLKITADLYQQFSNKDTTFIVLFHQAGWSRGEYQEIAPKLNRMGYNCMAVDLRSGKEVNGVKNETTSRAQKQKLGTSYVDALPDIESALRYTRENYADGSLIAWGSSYSAALVLKLAGDNKDLVDGVLAFAPGEYFQKFGKSANWIQRSAKKIRVPVFITSAKKESGAWTKIYEVIPDNGKVSYLPKTTGQHGSRALWDQFEDSTGYWGAVRGFLISFNKTY